MKLSIFILNFNTPDSTITCVLSIIDFYKEQLDKGEFEILIADNLSTDDSVNKIKKKLTGYKNIFLIENKENLGFAKGHNMLSKKAKGEYLFFLNSDARINNSELTKAVSFIEENKKIGVLGIKMENEDGSIQPSAGNFYSLFNTFLMLIGGERLGMIRKSPNKIEKVDWVSGGAMIVKSEIFQKIDGFEENFFMYVEDMELCFRVKNLGFQTYFYPLVTVYHKQLGSSNRTYAILNIYKGLSFFYKKHKPYWEYFLVRLLLKIKALIGIIIGEITRNSYLQKTYKEALKLSI